MARIVGAVSTGQTPRPDIVPALRELLGHGFDVLERGALDGLSSEQIAHIGSQEEDETLVTRLVDGTFVVVSARQITPLLQDAIDDVMAGGAEAIALLSTTGFHELHADVPLVLPRALLKDSVDALLPAGVLGVLVPLPGREQQAVDRWQTAQRAVSINYASPTGDPRDVERVAHFFAFHKVDAVVLDGISYTRAQAKTIGDIVKKPVVIPKVVLAQKLKEILG